MDRVTIKDLERKVDHINNITGSPLETYKIVDGKYIAQAGNYHLSGAYGGWKLVRMGNEGLSNGDVLYSGYVSKRELYNLLNSFISGIDAGAR